VSEPAGRTWSCKGAPRFRSIEVIGHGGLGVVHRVHDDETGQELALKTLPRPDPERAYHIKEEFRALAGMAHPNLVELYELVVEGDQCFFTMEILDGVPFTEYVWAAVAGGFRPSPAAGLSGAAVERLADAIAQLARGLSFLHREGKVHRDIKPSNVMVTRTGRVVLLDFDMAARIPADGAHGAEHGGAGFAGTPAYMAPEQLWGTAPASAADWYGVGVLLF
jgi:eukaryotic-like serine/threonine-protein kinase